MLLIATTLVEFCSTLSSVYRYDLGAKAEFEFDYGKESKDIKFGRRLEDPTLSFPVGCSFTDL